MLKLFHLHNYSITNSHKNQKQSYLRYRNPYRKHVIHSILLLYLDANDSMNKTLVKQALNTVMVTQPIFTIVFPKRTEKAYCETATVKSVNLASVNRD